MMADLDPLPTFTAPATLDDKPCLTTGNTDTRCQSQCRYLAHDGTLKPGCIFYPLAKVMAEQSLPTGA